MRAVIYARVSSDGQRERHTIDAQLSALPPFVASRGWELVGTYVDDGFSASAGKLDAREGLRALLRDAGRGEFDVVAVVDIDRLTRSDQWGERGLILGALQGAGVRIAELSGQVHDLDDESTDILVSVRAAMSAAERRKIVSRTAAGKDRAIANGRKPGGVTPYGLRYDRGAGEFSLRDEEAVVAREIYERLGAGESTVRLEADFNARGVPTGHAGRRNRAAMWWRERIYQIATSSIYRGEWVVDRRRHLSIAVPRIVSDELWYRVQDQLARGGRRGGRRTKRVYLCEEIALCALCGGRVGIHGSTPERRYYRCLNRKRGVGERCALPFLRTDVIDRRLWISVEHLLTRRWDELRALVAEQRKDAGASADDWARDVAARERRLAELDDAQRALVAQLAEGRLKPAAFEEGLRKVEVKRAAYHAQLAAARRALAREPRAADVLGALERLRDRLPDMSAETRRAAVRTIIPGRDDFWVVLGPGDDGPGTASERAMVRARGVLGADVASAGGSSTRTFHETTIALVA